MAEAASMTLDNATSAPNGRQRLAAWAERIGDRINPILVKEVRQAVRGREFNYSFWLSLLAGLIIAFVGSFSYERGAGAGVFTALMVCLGIVGLGIVPLGAYFTLSNERLEKTFELVITSTLSYRSIVLGKLLAQAVKLLIYFAALAPFMAMSFLLGGIDLLTILISITILFLVSSAACACSLFLSTLGKTRAMSFVILGVVIFAGMPFGPMMIFGSLMAYGIYGISRGYGAPFFGISSISGTGLELWWGLGIFFVFWLVGVTNLVLLTENRITPETDDRSTALRVGFFVQFLAVLAAPIVATFLVSGLSASEAVRAMIVLGAIHLGVVAIFAVTENPVPPRRVLRMKLRDPFRKISAAFFGPGAGAGVLYVLGQAVIFIGAVALMFQWMLISGAGSPSSSLSFGALDQQIELLRVLALIGYICFFTGIPTLAMRLVAPTQIRPIFVRVAILIFGALCLMVPEMIGLVLRQGFDASDTYSLRHILNPFWTMGEWEFALGSSYAWLVFGAGAVGLISYAWLMGLARKLRKTGGIVVAPPNAVPPVIAPQPLRKRDDGK